MGSGIGEEAHPLWCLIFGHGSVAAHANRRPRGELVPLTNYYGDVSVTNGAETADQADTELASRLRMAVTRLQRRLRQQGVGGLSPPSHRALTSVAKLGSPTLGELAAREAVQPPSMTRIVGALENMGYVTRIVDPHDRRVARVTLSPQGRAVLDHNRSAKNAYLAQRLLQSDTRGTSLAR